MLAPTGNPSCPVSILEKYMQRVGMTFQDQQWLFHPITKSKAREALTISGRISYTCLGEQFKCKLQELGFDPSGFGLHCLRADGATAPANAGVPDRNFKWHGRWRPEKAKDSYIEDSVESKLGVSKQLIL